MSRPEYDLTQLFADWSLASRFNRLRRGVDVDIVEVSLRPSNGFAIQRLRAARRA
jgi:hypothetical protein